jgi:hypothetical protein
VHTGQSGAPFRPLARPRVARGSRGRPLAHRTVRCTPDSPVIFSQTPSANSRERPVCFALAWRTGQCPVHTGQSGAPARNSLWLYIAISPLFFFFLCSCLALCPFICMNSHLSTCVGTQSPKYLEMAQGHISLSAPPCPQPKDDDEIKKMAEAIMDQVVNQLLNEAAEVVLRED